jgi:hypothetical protein
MSNMQNEQVDIASPTPHQDEDIDMHLGRIHTQTWWSLATTIQLLSDSIGVIFAFAFRET